ncbi:MAG: glycosyltransferase family 4 protein [Patulibacter sp.]
MTHVSDAATPRSAVTRALRRVRSARPFARTARPDRLTCVLGDLQVGGVARLYTDLLTQLVRDGRVCRIVAPDGPLRDELVERRIEWEPIDWDGPRLNSLRHLHALLEPGEPTIVVADPRTSHVIASAASRGPVVCAFHTTADLMDAWLGERPMQRLADVVRSLQAARGLEVLTIGEQYRATYVERFDWDPDAVTVLPPAIDVEAFPYADPPVDPDLIVCVARLSPEKHAHVRNAIKLVHAGRATGRDARLEFYGDGPWRAEAEALCAERLPAGSFTFHGATRRPAAALRSAGLVVATGLTALEAACIGRRVVISRNIPEDVLGPVFTTEHFDLLADYAFGGRFLPLTMPVDEAWDTLDRVRPEDLRAVRERVLAEHSLPTAARVLADVADRAAPRPPQQELRTAAELAASLQDELRDSRRVADEIWASRLQLQDELDMLQAERRSTVE